MTTKTRAPNWTQEEVRVLVVSYIEKKAIVDGKFSSVLTASDKIRAYQEITDAVNAVNQSARRTVDQVKKQLIDVKSKTKKKASAIKIDRQRTGGGPQTELQLTSIEEILVSTMNPQIIDGIIEDGDSEITTTNKDIYESNDQKSKTDVNLVNEIIEISTPKLKNETKRRRLSTNTPNENRITATHAEEILEIERSKRDIALQLVSIKKIKLKAYLKKLDAEGCDVLDELTELENI